MTKWTGNILTHALWWSMLGPFLGNWVGILYQITYQEARGRISGMGTWIVAGSYIAGSIFLAIMQVDLAPHAWKWIESSSLLQAAKDKQDALEEEKENRKHGNKKDEEDKEGLFDGIFKDDKEEKPTHETQNHRQPQEPESEDYGYDDYDDYDNDDDYYSTF